MDALLRFCQSATGGLILVVLATALLALLEVMFFSTLLRWLIRFVKDAWG